MRPKMWLLSTLLLISFATMGTADPWLQHAELDMLPLTNNVMEASFCKDNVSPFWTEIFWQTN